MRTGVTDKHPHEWIKNWGWKEVSKTSWNDVLLKKDAELARLLGSTFIVWTDGVDETPGPDKLGDVHYGYCNRNSETTAALSTASAKGTDEHPAKDVPRKRRSSAKRTRQTTSSGSATSTSTHALSGSGDTPAKSATD